MRRASAMLAAVGVLTLSLGINGFAGTDDGSKLTIKSPAPGAKVGKDIELVYELTKGSQATHAHCFVDGEYQKGWDKKTVKGQVHWVLPEEIGKVRVIAGIDDAIVRSSIAEALQR